MRVFEVILFDLDDTLWDARPALLRAEAAHHAWLEQHAPRVAQAHAPDELRRLRLACAARHPELAHDFTRLRRAALAELLAEYGYDAAAAGPAIAEFVVERSRVELYPDAAPALADLSRDHTLVALTNGNADLAVAGVAAYFTACISPAESGVQKPDARMFSAALAAVGAKAERAVHVGDQPLYDIEGAHRANLKSVWLNRSGAAWPADYAPAHAEVARLTEIRAALVRLAQSA